jgi:hypothetical protein
MGLPCCNGLFGTIERRERRLVPWLCLQLPGRTMTKHRKVVHRHRVRCYAYAVCGTGAEIGKASDCPVQSLTKTLVSEARRRRRLTWSCSLASPPERLEQPREGQLRQDTCQQTPCAPSYRSSVRQPPYIFLPGKHRIVSEGLRQVQEKPLSICVLAG